MAYEQKDMTGSIFKNTRRRTDNDPNAQGDCTIDGVQYWISAWVNKDKNDNTFYALKFRRKDPPPVPPEQPAYNDLITDEDLPF